MAWPGNYLFTKDFIDAGGLSFVTIEPLRLAQGYLAAHLDGKNPKVSAFYTPDKIKKSLERPIAMIKEACYAAGVRVNEKAQDQAPQAARQILISMQGA